MAREARTQFLAVSGVGNFERWFAKMRIDMHRLLRRARSE
ncbi:hypothetical protein D8I24_5499 (plasmid) [Cupriavidus necator H850]|nr:hypothetical protein D8I24_5499 [Cupriavidus necator H850]